MKKTKAFTVGTIAFLITPAGFGVSLIVGAAAAIITAACEAYADAETTDIELMETDSFRAVADSATLYGICGFILAAPNPIGLPGTFIKLGLCYIARPLWHFVVTEEGRKPNLDKHWFKMSKVVDGQVVSFNL